MVCIKQEIRFPEPPSLNSSELERAKGECVKDLEGRNEAAAITLGRMSLSDMGTVLWYAGASLCQFTWAGHVYFFTISQRLHINNLKLDMVAIFTPQKLANT